VANNGRHDVAFRWYPGGRAWAEPPPKGPGLYVDQAAGGPTRGHWVPLGDAMGGVEMGVYTPAVTIVTNVTTVIVVAEFSWLRIGRAVLVSGLLSLNPTVSGECRLRLSLPLPAAFNSVGDLSGVSSSPDSGTSSGGLIADTALHEALLGWDAPNPTSRYMAVMFLYRRSE
jgi:hypothetical protein